MASDALYQALAEALSQPSRAYRTARAALDIPNQALQGYVAGGDIADKIGQRKMNKQTLEEALQGNVPDRVGGYGNLRLSTLKDLGGLSGLASITKEKEAIDPIDQELKREFLQAKIDSLRNPKSPNPLDDELRRARIDALRKGPQGTETKENAMGRVSDTLNRLKDLYSNLDEMKAIVSTDRPGTQNIKARIGASGPGQLAGKALGTKAQSIRNQINQMRPLLINYIRQASAMGARGLDSEKELSFYLQAATDPGLDVQANLNALEVLNSAYGLGLNTGNRSANPSGNSDDPLGILQ